MKQKLAVTISPSEFMKILPDEEAVGAFAEGLMWQGTPKCPYCGSEKSYIIKRIKGRRCSSCRKNYTVKIGTIFEGSNLPLRKWLYAMYLLTSTDKGISSLQLSKELEVTQKTAWFIIHRLCEACNLSTDRVGNIVEIDEIYSGGQKFNKYGKIQSV